MMGLEPTTLTLLVLHSNQLSYTTTCYFHSNLYGIIRKNDGKNVPITVVDPWSQYPDCCGYPPTVAS